MLSHKIVYENELLHGRNEIHEWFDSCHEIIICIKKCNCHDQLSVLDWIF